MLISVGNLASTAGQIATSHGTAGDLGDQKRGPRLVSRNDPPNQLFVGKPFRTGTVTEHARGESRATIHVAVKMHSKMDQRTGPLPLHDRRDVDGVGMMYESMSRILARANRGT